MSENLEKTYNPKAIEAKLYEKWCDNKYFHAEVDRSKKPFTTVMPPPNITGKLHMGHALDNTLQDILIRYKRMQGYNALWIPGTDHAAISTEVKVTNQLKEEGIDKKELGREKFLERTWQWKEEYAGTIEGQLKKLGVSIALDDFGTGYSSLSYLKRLPIDVLKIDKSFVDGIGVDEKSEYIAESIIKLSHSLDLKVVAEGVETKEQLGYLDKMKCDIAQGYYFSKPEKFEIIKEMI